MPNPDLSVPLQVDFAEELAVDLGGPRKQFLAAIMREIKDKLFDNSGDLREVQFYVERDHYYAAGIYIGKQK